MQPTGYRKAVSPIQRNTMTGKLKYADTCTAIVLRQTFDTRAYLQNWLKVQQ